MEQIRKHLLKKGHSLEEAEPMAIRYAREVRAGMTIGSAFGADISLSGVTVMGALHFHFRAGRARDTDLVCVCQEATLLARRADSFLDISNRSFNDTISLIESMNMQRVIAPDGQVWGE
jgi:hypothetical protein